MAQIVPRGAMRASAERPPHVQSGASKCSGKDLLSVERPVSSAWETATTRLGLSGPGWSIRPVRRRVARDEDERAASASWNCAPSHGFSSASSRSSGDRTSSALVIVIRAQHGALSYMPYRGVTMQNGRETNINTRQSTPAAPFAARSQRWSSNAARPRTEELLQCAKKL
jgi:hypothetical protein